jgi:hypothetical protein
MAGRKAEWSLRILPNRRSMASVLCRRKPEPFAGPEAGRTPGPAKASRADTLVGTSFVQFTKFVPTLLSTDGGEGTSSGSASGVPVMIEKWTSSR